MLTNVQWDEPRISHAEAALARVLSFFPRVDAKFSVVLGVGLAMLASIGAGSSTVSYWTVGLAVFPMLATIGVAISLANVYLSSFPHLKGPDQSEQWLAEAAAKKANMPVSDLVRELIIEHCQRESIKLPKVLP